MNQEEIALKEITQDTLDAILRLDVHDNQKNLVAPNAVSIAQARFSEHAWFRGIYAGDTPVGFVMMYIDAEKPDYYLWRFMIDKAHQGKGYGYAAMQCVIDFVKQFPNARKIELSYAPAEGNASPFYTKCGFIDTGELDDDGYEIIMRLDLQTPSPDEVVNRIIVRIMEAQDVATISEAFRQPPWNKPEEQYRRYFQEQIDGKRTVLTAFYNDDFAGYGTICWTSEYAPFAEQQIPEIVDLNVLEQFRRKGIATQLMDRAEAEIAKHSAVAGIGFGMYSDYGPAQRMYVEHGYIPDARGLMQDGKTVAPGTSVLVDDELAIYLTKQLT